MLTEYLGRVKTKLPMKTVLLVQVAATLFMTGVIWMVQVVHYPLFSSVGIEEFGSYHRAHSRLITYVVFPAMAVELVTSIMLVTKAPPGVFTALAWFGLALVAVIWLSTAVLQVPHHNRLATGFSPETHSALVAGNWLRTVAWSARSVVVIWMLSALMRGAPQQ